MYISNPLQPLVEREASAGHTMIAKSRSHLASCLDGHMNRVQNGASDASGRSGSGVPIKTYLIEGRGPDPDPDDLVGPFGTLGRIALDPAFLERYSPRVHPSSDADLATIAGRQDGDCPVFVYADYADPRFWLLHTTAPGRSADRFISMLVAAHRGVGRAALTSESLAAVADMGATVALSLDHERQVVERDAPGAGPSEFVKARVWGTQARRVTALMRQFDTLSEGIALSQIRTRHSPDGEDRFCLSDVRFDGRIVTRGNSFAALESLAGTIRANYNRHVERIETHHRVRLEDREGVLLGRSLALHLTCPVPDLHQLCRTVFSTARPYLIWGLPVRRGPGSVSARGVDLNLGHRVDFEFTQEFIRLFIPRGTSGGVVKRFYANVQRHLDPRVRLLDQDEHEILQL